MLFPLSKSEQMRSLYTRNLHDLVEVNIDGPPLERFAADSAVNGHSRLIQKEEYAIFKCL